MWKNPYEKLCVKFHSSFRNDFFGKAVCSRPQTETTHWWLDHSTLSSSDWKILQGGISPLNFTERVKITFLSACFGDESWSSQNRLQLLFLLVLLAGTIQRVLGTLTQFIVINTIISPFLLERNWNLERLAARFHS